MVSGATFSARLVVVGVWCVVVVVVVVAVVRFVRMECVVVLGHLLMPAVRPVVRCARSSRPKVP